MIDATLPALLFSVIVMVDVPVCTAAVNDLLPVIVLTVSVTAPDDAIATPLALVPGTVLAVVAVAVTGTMIVQVAGPAPAGAGPRLPPVSVNEVTVLVRMPPQLLVMAPATLIVTGQESVNVIGERFAMPALKFLIVIIIVDDPPPDGIGFGAKLFANCPPVWTVMLALIAGLVAPSAVTSAPAAMVFVDAPLTNALGFRAMTSTLIVHDPLAGIVPPASVTVAGLVAGSDAVAVGGPVTTPPGVHVVWTLDGVAIVMFAGSESVMPAAVNGTGFGFVSVMVSVDAPG